MSSYLSRSGEGLLSPASVSYFLDGLEMSQPAEVVEPKAEIGYRPQPKQAKLIKACGLLEWFEGQGQVREPVTQVIGYGGAAYGAKTYGALGLGLICALAFPGCQISFFRRTYTELDGPGAAMFEANEIFGGLGKRRDDGKHWHFKNGSDFYFRHCENEMDVTRYDSQQFDILLIDEATHFTWFQVDYLLTRNRVSGRSGIVKPFTVLLSMPGNIGHGWYMELFDLDVEPGRAQHEVVKHRLNPNGKYSDVFFIPSYITDNRIGLERDPDYEKRLRERDPDLAEALIAGDWRVFKGMAFRDFDRSVHVCEPFELPWEFPKWRAVDWGDAAPFCCLWFAKDPATKRVYVHRELYGEGLSDKEQAVLIAENSPREEGVSITYADPAMWVSHNYDGHISTMADEYLKNGVPLWKGDNNRLNGKKKVDRLLGNLADGKPGLVIFSNCVNLIRTLPKLARSRFNPEDVEQRGQEDHAYDALRYGLTNVDLFSHPRKKKDPNDPAPSNPWKALAGIT